MSEIDRPQLYLITPPEFDLDVFPQRLAAVLEGWQAPDIWLTLYYPPYDRLPVRLTQFSDFVADYVTRVRPLG